MIPNEIIKEQLDYPTFELINATPKISVLMTVYNEERFLAESIESVLNQTFNDFEFIIVNDGSTDNTENIIKDYMKKDKRIICIKNEINKGFNNLGNVVNMGLKKARGKYIARIDADDICYLNRFEIQYNYLERHPNIFLIGSSADVIDTKGNKIDVILKKNYPSWLLKYRIAFSNPFIHTSIIFRNEEMSDGVALKYDGKAEYTFYVMLFYYGKKIKNIKDILVKYRINPNGLMSRYGNMTNNKYKEFYKEENDKKNIKKD